MQQVGGHVAQRWTASIVTHGAMQNGLEPKQGVYNMFALQCCSQRPRRHKAVHQRQAHTDGLKVAATARLPADAALASTTQETKRTSIPGGSGDASCVAHHSDAGIPLHASGTVVAAAACMSAAAVAGAASTSGRDSSSGSGPAQGPAVVVFSGGTAFNSVAALLKQVRQPAAGTVLRVLLNRMQLYLYPRQMQ